MAITGTDRSPPADAFDDEYLQWAIETNFEYLNEGEDVWYPVLLEVEGTASEFWANAEHVEVRNAVRVPPIYKVPPNGIAGLSYCSAVITRRALLGLGDKTAVHFKATFPILTKLLGTIKRLELGSPVIRDGARLTAAAATDSLGIEPALGNIASGPAPAQKVIVATIDDGLAFAHERFRDATGRTRFEFFWNQDDKSKDGGPLGFGWGRELDKTQINSLLAANRHAGIVDEDKLYRQAGQRLTRRRARHGTHVMDIACGLDPKDQSIDWDSAPHLIGVQLPRWATAETSGAWLTPVVLDAIHYVLSCADRLAVKQGSSPLPVVINLSYGKIAGPHDGTELLEAAIDQLIAQRQTPLRVILPAGNHHLARCHAELVLQQAGAGRQKALEWRVQPDDRSAKFMEIWLPPSQPRLADPEISVRITAPDGTQSPWIGRGSRWRLKQEKTVRFLAIYSNPSPARPRSRIVLAMAPTSQTKSKPLTARSGTWRVELRNVGSEIEVHAWVQRGDTPFGYPLRGRQSRLHDTQYVRFDDAGRLEERDTNSSRVRRASTINALATGQHVIVVGGFRRSDYAASAHSGSGPAFTALGSAPREGPDVTAVADDTPVLQGVLAAGTHTGSVVSMSGTSVAAPQIARLVSELLAANLPSDREAVIAVAIAKDAAPALPAIRGGAGRIERPANVKMRWTRFT